MPIISCPQCQSKLEIDAQSADEEVECGSCQHVFRVLFPSKKSSKRETDDEESPSRRSRREDDDDEDNEEEYERERRPSGRRKPTPMNGMALASMICGIVGLVIEFPGCVCCGVFSAVGMIPAIVGLVLGIIAGKSPQGKGFRLTGLITSGIAIALGILMVILMVIYGAALMGGAAAGGPGGNPPVFRGAGR